GNICALFQQNAHIIKHFCDLITINLRCGCILRNELETHSPIRSSATCGIETPNDLGTHTRVYRRCHSIEACLLHHLDNLIDLRLRDACLKEHMQPWRSL